MAKKKKKKKPISNFLEVKHGKINRNQKGVPEPSDLGNPELENHHILKIEYVDAEGEVTTPDKGRKRVKNITQTTLDYCKTYYLIDEAQYHAGEQLYKDCYYSGFVPHAVVATYSGMPKSSSNWNFSFLEGRVDAMKRYNFVQKKLRKRKIERESNITFWDIAYQICVEGIAIDDLEKWVKWPRRSGKKLLGLVLDDVFEAYEDLSKKARKEARKKF